MLPVSKERKTFLFIYLLPVWRMSATGLPNERKDVIGQYTLTNEHQYHKLCWYRTLCNSYSYRMISTASQTPLTPSTGNQNCMLHAKFAITSLASDTRLYDPGWKEVSVPSVGINNGCKSRPCSGREVCVPTSAVPGPGMTSHICLPMPSRCVTSISLSNGYANISGRSQDDAVFLSCVVGYVASPRGVPLTLKCLITGSWSEFKGTCERYLFNHVGIVPSKWKLPWKLEEMSALCLQGVFTEEGQFYINLESVETNVIHLTFRYKFKGDTGVFFDVKENGTWLGLIPIGDMPLVPGDSFSLTIRLQNDSLIYELNAAHVYIIPLADVQFNKERVQASDLTYISSANNRNLTYVNLISEC